jgi:hypothetical protein
LHIQNPVLLIFDAPMWAYRLGQTVTVGQRCYTNC